MNILKCIHVFVGMFLLGSSLFYFIYFTVAMKHLKKEEIIRALHCFFYLDVVYLCSFIILFVTGSHLIPPHDSHSLPLWIKMAFMCLTITCAIWIIQISLRMYNYRRWVHFKIAQFRGLILYSALTFAQIFLLLCIIHDAVMKKTFFGV